MITTKNSDAKEPNSLQFDNKAYMKPSEEKYSHSGEMTQLIGQIGEHKVRIEELKQKVIKLEREKKEEKEIYLKAAKNWETDLNKKKEERVKINKELEEMKKEAESRMLDLMGQKNHEIEGLKSEVYNTRLELSQVIEGLKVELKGLKEFKDRREEYFKQVNYWKRRCDELINLRGVKTEPDERDKSYDEIMGKKRGAEIIRERSRRATKQDLSFQEEVLVGYQTTNFKQECKIKKLKEKVFSLNNHITQESSNHTKESESIKYRLQGRIHELEQQVHNLKEELSSKIKDNKSLKALSQIILDQRSEVEEFLIGTLDHIKEEAKKLKIGEKKKKFPEILAKAKIEEKSKRNWNKLDFSSFDWDEREKILSILFSKLNNGLLPGNWRDASLERSIDTGNRSFNMGLNSTHFSTRETQRNPTRGGI